jgi:zinc protease
MIRAFFFALFLLPLQLSAATKVQEVVSPGGIRAWLVEEHSIPMIAIELEFTGGVETDPVDRVGVSNFLGAMLDEGAGDLDATAFRNRADDLSLRMGAEAGRTSFSVSARMLLENRDESLELLRLALSAPRFDPEPLARVRSQILSGIRSDATDPQSIATKRWRELMFQDQPRARSDEGLAEVVEIISAADLEAARQRIFTRAGVSVAVVGAVTAEELGPMLDALLGGLSDTPAQEAPTPVFAPERGVEVVPFETPQSVAVLGHEGLSRDDPDFIAATVMNQILGGGGFSSRLTEEVREKRGLTYSVYSYISPRPDEVGVYMAGVSADNARIAEAIEVIRAEWRRMAEGGVTADELEKTKRYLTGAYPLRFDSNAKIASMLAAIQHAGLGVDYIDRRNDLVEAVTQEDVARVAKRLLHDDRLRIVVVGQPVGITTN